MVKKKKKKAKKAVTKKKIKTRARKSKPPAKKKKRKVKKAIKKVSIPLEEGTLIGKVTHYFPHVKAGAILIGKGQLVLGDIIRVKGHTSDFKQKIMSMQIDRVSVEKASKGQEIGILVKARVRIHDKVYKI
ncbi:MAG: hypothetical protein KKD29_04485 [Candidatus Omnitrophica bacterium]|nr:hypothetical protein [Candidatus Omnitrophota bacterium]MBU4488727.1 hypothetical protein [Candidatus Omnitrophota bacterium]MCG2705824.1 hypothetical protein [Candidatus Omnitrophota bacterium]